MGKVGQKEGVVKFWERSISYSGYKKKIQNFQRSHFQCIFSDFGFLDITPTVKGTYS